MNMLWDLFLFLWYKTILLFSPKMDSKINISKCSNSIIADFQLFGFPEDQDSFITVLQAVHDFICSTDQFENGQLEQMASCGYEANSFERLDNMLFQLKTDRDLCYNEFKTLKKNVQEQIIRTSVDNMISKIGEEDLVERSNLPFLFNENGHTKIHGVMVDSGTLRRATLDPRSSGTTKGGTYMQTLLIGRYNLVINHTDIKKHLRSQKENEYKSDYRQEDRECIKNMAVLFSNEY